MDAAGKTAPRVPGQGQGADDDGPSPGSAAASLSCVQPKQQSVLPTAHAFVKAEELLRPLLCLILVVIVAMSVSPLCRR